MWVQVQGDGRVPVTRLSRRARHLHRINVILRLAWRSLLLFSIMLVEGSCIVADPPEYQAPGQTRPVLNVYAAQPTATRALLIPTNGVNKPITKFNVGVRSEDAGEPLRAVFFLDYQMRANLPQQAGEKLLVSKTIPASTYDNPGRVVQYEWPSAASDGCHFMSLIVAHRSTFLEENDEAHLDPDKADDDAAIVTWTVNMNPPEDGALLNCPSNDTIPP